VPRSEPNSCCASGLPVDFYWYGCATPGLAAKVQAAVDALVRRAPSLRRAQRNDEQAMSRASPGATRSDNVGLHGCNRSAGAEELTGSPM
jgi:hypothetical protein